MQPFLLVGLAALVMGALAYVGYLQNKRRRELLQQFAASNGWSWVARDDSWTERFGGTPFGEGDHRQACNVLQGSFRNRPMIAFDYSYQTHSTDSQGRRSTTTHRYAFCSLALPAAVPKLELVPESAFGRLGTALGMQDIELESEDFNRRYRVRSDNPKFAYDVLPPRTMQAMLSRAALHLRFLGADALCWESGRHSPAELLQRLDALSTVIDGIPDFVWSDLKGSAS
ncbi:MAG: hypothetical protein WCD35_06800 [Mycobacteriales bacterium]